MKPIRTCVYVFTLIFFCMLFTGCDLKKQEPDVYLSLKVPMLTQRAISDPEIESAGEFLEKAAEAYMEEHENVTIDITVFSLTEEEASITDCFDTEDAADILYEGYFNMAGYVHTGRVVPLDDIITENIKSDIPDSLWNMSKVNGKTYMMPYLSLQNIIVYNKALFRQAGLDQFVSDQPEIQSWKLEEWEEILDTLAKNRPDSVFPMIMFAKNEQGDTHIMTLLRSHGSKFFDKNGRFQVNTPEGVEALSWIKEGYEKNWFPKRCENLEMVDNVNLFSHGQLAIYISNNTALAFDGLDVGYSNFPSMDGKGMATSFVTGFEVFDNGDPEKVEAAKDFVKFIYETEQWLDYSAGGIPASKKTTGKYQGDISMLEDFYNNSANVIDFTGNNPNWRGVRNAFWPHIHALLEGSETPEEAAAGIDEDCNRAIEEGYLDSKLHE